MAARLLREHEVAHNGIETIATVWPPNWMVPIAVRIEGDEVGSPLAFSIVASCLWNLGMVIRLTPPGVPLSVPLDSNGVLIDGILQATSYKVGFCVERYSSRPFRERSCM